MLYFRKYIFILIIICSGTSYSQSDSVFAYLPLQIGNLWQYKVNHIVFGPNQDTTTYYLLTKVERDTVFSNGYQYCVLRSSDSTTNFYHIDSSTACVYVYNYDSSRGFKVDSLKCSVGDWFGENYYCAFIDTATVLNYRTWRMGIENNTPDITLNHTLAMDIGVVYKYRYESYFWGQEWISELVYAKINGVEFGELVNSLGGKPIELYGFYLDQNYPNPFNPSTKIKYSIPIVGTSDRVSVQLKVYDVLGNQIATLVNEERSAGVYEVEFDASNLSSGVYFYTLSAGNYFDTKKMILLR